MMLNLNGKQILQIVGVFISVAMVSSANLTTLLGAGVATTIVTIAGMANMVLQGVAVVLQTQTNQIKDVAAMPGVDRISINANASAEAAAVAVDKDQPKVGPTTPEVRATLLNKVG
jgi:hypothetical protein